MPVFDIMVAIFFMVIITFVIAIAIALVKQREAKVSDEKVAAASLIALSTVPTNIGGIAAMSVALGTRGKHEKPSEEPKCDDCHCKKD
ncbi:MAG: hypothetical protein Q8R25_00815 [bacterium]|nr:hypothetical protein [bacterium]